MGDILTLLIDPRAGSEKLLKPLLALGLPAVSERLAFGDVAFQGKGEGGCPVSVGIEYKTLGDALQCMRDSRFTSHQLPGLRDCYEDIWLVIEGLWIPRADGMLMVRRGPKWGSLPGAGRRQMTYERLSRWLLTLSIRGGIRVLRSSSTRESVLLISSLYHWWTFAPIETHSGHLQTSLKGTFVDSTGLLPASEEMRMLAQIDGLSKVRAAAALKHFGSVRAAAVANEKEWGKVPGIGKLLAANAVSVMTRRQEED